MKAGGTITGGGTPGSVPPKLKRSGDEIKSSGKKPNPKRPKKIGDPSDSDSSSDSGSDDQPATKKTAKKSSPNSWDTTSLKRLHKHLNSLQDPQQLQEIVNVIEQTGQYNLTASTFDFDLCKLDDHTLNKLSKFMESSGAS